MKRILLVFLTVVLVTAFGFSQELKFDGYLNSGFGWWVSNKDGEDALFEVYGVDSERNIGRFRLNGAFTNEKGTGGLNFRIQAQHNGTTTEGNSAAANAFSMAYGYAWIKAFNMLTLKAGLVDDSTWATGDVIYADDQGEGVGLLIKLAPVKGLDLGVGAYAASFNSGSHNNFLGVPTKYQQRPDKIKYTFNASYTMDKVFRLMMSGRLKNETGGDATQSTAHLLAEFRLLAVPNLTAVLVGELDNLSDFSDFGRINFYETIGYRLNDLSFGINAAQYISRKTGDDFGLRLNPWISYALAENRIVPRLDFVYFLGGRSGGSSADYGKGYHRRSFTADYNKDTFVLNARPSVKFNLDPRTILEFGDSFYFTKISGGDGVVSNALYLDITIRF